MKFPSTEKEQEFDKVFKDLPRIINEACDGYDELYGHKLIAGSDPETAKFYNEQYAKALFFKFAKGYQFDFDEAVKNLTKTLNWRKEFKPWKAAFADQHRQELEEAGIITYDAKASSNTKVITWNLYGKLNKNRQLFKDSNAFVQYRIGLMERGLQLLDFLDDENSYMTQVHDYSGVSLFTFDGNVRKCTKTVVEMFQSYYPELLYAKYFVAVPRVLSWVYDLVKTFVSEETRKKFVVLSGSDKLGESVPGVPKAYGGTINKTLEEISVKNIKPNEYILYLIQKDVIETVE
ncbi:HHL281Wp [Eremothecium sinecaudum]|uniref:Phosphatidylinositol transfer protein SFH5 n=1 Tax=Eremothecium sinecaudum TaxID=45286 RepID=A0A0X8HVX9_9SACH|nr:HHL281Wp [Eremothecium sinecaudum]AMD22489.1 HHL281Wp [Eremothecium sinecaudum]